MDHVYASTSPGANAASTEHLGGSVSRAAVARRGRVSGRYQGKRGKWTLELRVDIDGLNTTRRISGDLDEVSSTARRQFGSFQVKSTEAQRDGGTLIIYGLASLSFESDFPWVVVMIQGAWAAAPTATVEFYSWLGRRGSRFRCKYVSPYFRSVDIEEDHESFVVPFTSHDTGSLPSGGRRRQLTVAGAYAEAGIELRATGGSNEVTTPPDSAWSNSELHHAMEEHFSRWRDAPQWKLWLFHAMQHEKGPRLLGIMYDRQGAHRQGCAVFYAGIRGEGPRRDRSQLFTCVHELGHCFNLFHSFQKARKTPPTPNRPEALSWMNYPQLYPHGSDIFWGAFPFQFDLPELAHLRHGFRSGVKPGDMPFGISAALENDGGAAHVIEDLSGLKLDLRAPDKLRLGEPVFVELKLSTKSGDRRTVHRHLHPDEGLTKIAIEGPNGRTVAHVPMLTHCAEVSTVELSDELPAIYDSFYIGFGRQGHHFDQPGVYRIVATYEGLGGSETVSNVQSVRVRHPMTAADEAVAELLLGDAQGRLLYLQGSDSSHLRSGNDALREILEEYQDHPLTLWATLTIGFNALRKFKQIDDSGRLRLREPEAEEGIEALEAVVTKSRKEREGVDNIMLNRVLCQLIRSKRQAGDDEGSDATFKDMMNIFSTMRDFPEPVLKTIDMQGRQALGASESVPLRKPARPESDSSGAGSIPPRTNQ